MGPSNIIGLPDSKTLIMIGLPIVGFIQALVFIPSLPEAIEITQQKFKIVEKSDLEFDDKLNDTMGALFSLTYNFSGLFAPIIGGLMYDNFSTTDATLSYRRTMDANVVFELFMALFFIIGNCGCSVWAKDK
tara:strand:- start:29 stop:424 length:396 start_codon:yes stop_codon:yes gene_type:complete